MIYSIWKDVSFYVYLLVAISSAVVIVYSIRRLFEKEDDVIEEEVDITDNVVDGREERFSTILENPDESTTTVKEEEIIFKKEETIFDVGKKTQDSTFKKDDDSQDKAILFIKNLNENLTFIKDNLERISELEKRIQEMNERMVSFENDFKEILKGNIHRENSDTYMSDQKQPTPAYIFKYLNDILENFDSLEKNAIRKRIEFIAKDLKDIR